MSASELYQLLLDLIKDEPGRYSRKELEKKFAGEKVDVKRTLGQMLRSDIGTLEERQGKLFLRAERDEHIEPQTVEQDTLDLEDFPLTLVHSDNSDLPELMWNRQLYVEAIRKSPKIRVYRIGRTTESKGHPSWFPFPDEGPLRFQLLWDDEKPKPGDEVLKRGEYIAFGIRQKGKKGLTVLTYHVDAPVLVRILRDE